MTTFFTWLWEMINGPEWQGPAGPPIAGDQAEGSQAFAPGPTEPGPPAAGGLIDSASVKPSTTSKPGAGAGPSLKLNLKQLTVKCSPKIKIYSDNDKIKTILNGAGYSLADVEWQDEIKLHKYAPIPKYDPEEKTKLFNVRIFKVISGETGGANPIVFFDKYVSYDSPYPAWDLLLTVAERDNYPLVAMGSVSKDQPFKVDLPPGYYIIAPDKDHNYNSISKWWVVWGPLDNVKMSRWEAFKTFWDKDEKLTDIHRFRYSRWYDTTQWCRLMHVDKDESFNYKPVRYMKFQDYEKPPKSWDEKIAQWAEEKAEAMFGILKEMFT